MAWVPDELLEGFEQFQWELTGVNPEPGESGAPLTATLVRAHPPTRRAAVMWLHGWNDYFFHRHVADFFARLGFDFYALELRRYGRNLRPQQYAGYITSLTHYDLELDRAREIIGSEHDSVILMAHSTGGLIAALHVDRRPYAYQGLILNSGWIKSDPSWTTLTPLMHACAAVHPSAVVPMRSWDTHTPSTHASLGGEWDFQRRLKGSPQFRVRFGWISAVLHGHEQIARGIDIPIPVLSLTSDRTRLQRHWTEELKTADVVLDVDTLVEGSRLLGSDVEIIQIPRGMHDLTLSLPSVRARTLAEIEGWLGRVGMVPDQAA